MGRIVRSIMRPGSQEFERATGVIAARVRQLRQERGLSQEELADRAGCHRTYVGMLERRQGNPSLAVLAALADALGVALGELVAGPPA